MKTKLFLSMSLLSMAFSVVNATSSCEKYAPTAEKWAQYKVLRDNVVKSANAKAAGKIAGLYAGFASVGLPVHMYITNKEAQAEATRLANRSAFEKASDYVSGQASTFGTKVSKLAQSAKANTWDTNKYFNHSGKVATVAGVTAVAGLSYLAYKNNPFGKAVVKTVETKVVTSTPAPVVAKRRIVSAI